MRTKTEATTLVLLAGFLLFNLVTSVVAEPDQTVSEHRLPATATQRQIPLTASPIGYADYEIELLGTIRAAALREASGIAQSTRQNDLWWSHNDSGFGPRLFAISGTGEELGNYVIEQASSRDWEDMASFVWRDRSWLAIADTGDNGANKMDYRIHLLIEPEPTRPAPRIRIFMAGSLGPALAAQRHRGPAPGCRPAVLAVPAPASGPHPRS